MRDQPTSSCRHPERMLHAVCALVFCFSPALPLMPSVAPSQQNETKAADDAQAEHAGETDASNREEKKRVVTVAFMLWWGIVFAGLGLLALIVLWGIRTRRIARIPLPAQSRTDDLWYLKSKNTNALDDSGESESDDPGDVEP